MWKCDIEQEEGRSDGFTNVSMLFTLFNGDQFGIKAPYKDIEGADTSDNSNTKYGVGGFAFGNGKTGSRRFSPEHR